jgi:hypothetical protein
MFHSLTMLQNILQSAYKTQSASGLTCFHDRSTHLARFVYQSSKNRHYLRQKGRSWSFESTIVTWSSRRKACVFFSKDQLNLR